MNKGMSIQDFAAALIRVEAGKRDLVVPTIRMRMMGGAKLVIDGREEFNIGDFAHDQISARLGIPREYYNRMREQAPYLLDQSVNTWFDKKPERRLIRTYENKVRAVLSDRYKMRENITVLDSIIPIIKAAGDIEILSANVSEKQMYMKAISHKLTGEVRVGEVVKGGVAVRNSEVGCGTFDISLFIYVLACKNGMIREKSMREYHIGRRLETDENSFEYSRETIMAQNEAFRLEVRDHMKNAFSSEAFEKEIVKFQAATSNQLNPTKIPETIEDVTKRYSMTMEEGHEIMGRLLAAKDFTQWGLSSAVTNLANDLKDYDRSTELEKIGGKIIDLQNADWRIVARAA